MASTQDLVPGTLVTVTEDKDDVDADAAYTVITQGDWTDVREKHGIGIVVAAIEVGKVFVLWSGPSPSSRIEEEFTSMLDLVS